MPNVRRHQTPLVLAAAFHVVLTVPLAARDGACKASQIDTLIDGTGQYLRTFAQQRRPILHQKFEALAVHKKWPSESAIERGYEFARDTKTVSFDVRARELLIELDEIGARSAERATCEDLERLKSVTQELRTVTQAKFDGMVARVDAALQSEKQARAVETKPKPEPKKAKPVDKLPAWQTTTQESPEPPAVVMNALPPPDPAPATRSYSAIEIREAGRGFFGNISAGLASVIQYAFKNYGKPNGYILGTEGGGAFLAGISYGEGHLNTKTHSRLKVFWQSPSVGYDLGLQGSRVMILVYNLSFPKKIFKRYAGIGGSAYVVGGVGLTYHKRGNIVLAPIRTGIGLRLGANIGYLKFTPKLSINPF